MLSPGSFNVLAEPTLFFFLLSFLFGNTRSFKTVVVFAKKRGLFVQRKKRQRRNLVTGSPRKNQWPITPTKLIQYRNFQGPFHNQAVPFIAVYRSIKSSPWKNSQLELFQFVRAWLLLVLIEPLNESLNVVLGFRKKKKKIFPVAATILQSIKGLRSLVKSHSGSELNITPLTKSGSIFVEEVRWLLWKKWFYFGADLVKFNFLQVIKTKRFQSYSAVEKKSPRKTYLSSSPFEKIFCNFSH